MDFGPNGLSSMDFKPKSIEQNQSAQNPLNKARRETNFMTNSSDAKFVVRTFRREIRQSTNFNVEKSTLMSLWSRILTICVSKSSSAKVYG